MAEFTSHTKWVWNACFAPDDQSLATSSDDRLIIVWNIANRTSGAHRI